MPVKLRRRPRSTTSLAKRLARVEAQLTKLTRAGVVSCAEYDEVVGALEQRTKELELHTKDLDIQFQRIAQLQADLDEIKRTRTT